MWSHTRYTAERQIWLIHNVNGAAREARAAIAVNFEASGEEEKYSADT